MTPRRHQLLLHGMVDATTVPRPRVESDRTHSECVWAHVDYARDAQTALCLTQEFMQALAAGDDWQACVAADVHDVLRATEWWHKGRAAAGWGRAGATAMTARRVILEWQKAGSP